MQGKVLNRAMAIGVAAMGLIFAVPALAQESAIEFTSLEPIEDIITNFESGVPTVGLSIEADDPDAAIRSQFQIMVNFSPSAVFAEEDVAFTPSGFVEGSTTEIESVAEYFVPPDEMKWLPPLHPWIDPYSRVAIAVELGGWTVYGEEGLIEGVEDAFEPLQSVWGIELAEPFDTTCSQAAFVGRAWEGSSITTGPDPLFTPSALNGRYAGDSHEALSGTASRIVELSCRPGGEPTVVQNRMKEGAGIRIFGPTGSIAMVKGTSVVFFSPVRIHDGDLRQQFFATPAGGGQVEATIVDDDPKLLVPNPYAEFGTKVTIVPIEEVAGEAAADTATGMQLLHTSTDGSSVRTQSGGGCAPRADEIFMNAFTVAAMESGFAQKPSLVAISTRSALMEFEFPGGVRQRIRIRANDFDSPEKWELEIISASGPSCTTAVDIVNRNGEKLAVPSDQAADDTATEEQPGTPSDSGSAQSGDEPETGADASDGGSTIPWVPVGLIIAAGAGGTYAYTKTRKKPPTATPPTDAPDDSTVPPPVPPPAPTATAEEPKGPRTFTAEDRAALQEVYKGADDAGLKVVGISEITRLEDVLAGSKDDPVVIGKATKIEVGVAADGTLVAPGDPAATSRLSVEAIPSVEHDSSGDKHIVWNGYAREEAADGSVTTTRSGPSAAEWEAKVDGRSDTEIGEDPTFTDWKVGSMADSPADAVQRALAKRG